MVPASMSPQQSVSVCLADTWSGRYHLKCGYEPCSCRPEALPYTAADNLRQLTVEYHERTACQALSLHAAGWSASRPERHRQDGVGAAAAGRMPAVPGLEQVRRSGEVQCRWGQPHLRLSSESGCRHGQQPLGTEHVVGLQLEAGGTAFAWVGNLLQYT